MNWTSVLSRIIGSLIMLVISCSAEFLEVCLDEKFEARCPDGHVIVMQSSRFGRMKLGRCAQTNYGMLGCSEDVLHLTDRECSGKQECIFDIFNTFKTTRPCGELKCYLEVNFTCLRVSTPKSQECHKKSPTVISKPSGYISSYDIKRQLSHYSHRFCTYQLEAAPGQKWNLTLHDFAGRYHSVQRSRGQAYMTLCQKYATIRETHQPQSQGQVICGGNEREKNVGLSPRNTVFIDVYDSANEADARHFIIEYQVVGCADPKIDGVHLIRRSWNEALVRCNASEETLKLRCENMSWHGAPLPSSDCGIVAEWSIWAAMTEDWTTPYGLLLVTGIGIALGVIVGVFLLAVAVACYRRQQRLGQLKAEREQQPLKDKCTYDAPPPRFPPPVELPNPALYADYSVPASPRPIPPQSAPPSTGPGITDQGYEQNFLIQLRTDDGKFAVVPSNDAAETLQLKSRMKNMTPPVSKRTTSKALSYLDQDDHVYEIPE